MCLDESTSSDLCRRQARLGDSEQGHAEPRITARTRDAAVRSMNKIKGEEPMKRRDFNRLLLDAEGTP